MNRWEPPSAEDILVHVRSCGGTRVRLEDIIVDEARVDLTRCPARHTPTRPLSAASPHTHAAAVLALHVLSSAMPGLRVSLGVPGLQLGCADSHM